MVSLKNNLPQLQIQFLQLHPFLSLGNKEEKSFKNKIIPGAKILNEFVDTCLITNEISGLNRILHNGSWIIAPSFSEGTEPAKLMLAVTGKHAEALVKAETILPHKSFNQRKHWSAEDYRSIEQLFNEPDPIKVLKGALLVAFRILDNSPDELGIVCGPMSTGKKSVETNLTIFNKTVYRKSLEIEVFNQLPFVPLFATVHEKITTTHQHLLEGSCSSCFFHENFYEPIFSLPKKTWRPSFIEGWDASVGARSEHDFFATHNAPIQYLDANYHVN